MNRGEKMNIAFWTSAKGGSGVTSNLACISVASAMEYAYRALLIESHHQKNTLGNVLRYQQVSKAKEEGYNFRRTGMDYIINEFSAQHYYNDFTDQPLKAIRNKLIGEEEETRMSSTESRQTAKSPKEKSQIFKEAALEILDNYVYYVPNSEQINKNTFDYNLYDNIKDILDASDTFADITYIDTSNANSLSSKIILEEVDLVVVNLTQSATMIKYFFDNYSSILNKSVFLISSYNKNSNLNINKISKTYSINKSNIAAIPYNIDFQEAVSQGRVVEFLSSHYACKRINPNYHFVREVKKAVYMIFKNIENLGKEEVCL
jgi:hypothetical protein